MTLKGNSRKYANKLLRCIFKCFASKCFGDIIGGHTIPKIFLSPSATQEIHLAKLLPRQNLFHRWLQIRDRQSCIECICA